MDSMRVLKDGNHFARGVEENIIWPNYLRWLLRTNDYNQSSIHKKPINNQNNQTQTIPNKLLSIILGQTWKTHRIMAPKAASSQAQEIQAELLLEMEQERLFSEANWEQRWIGMEWNSNSHQISEAGFPTSEAMFETWNYGKKAKKHKREKSDRRRNMSGKDEGCGSRKQLGRICQKKWYDSRQQGYGLLLEPQGLQTHAVWMGSLEQAPSVAPRVAASLGSGKWGAIRNRTGSVFLKVFVFGPDGM